MIEAIESVRWSKVVRVITNNAPIYKAGGLIVESKYNYIFGSSCIVYRMEEFEFLESSPWLCMAFCTSDTLFI